MIKLKKGTKDGQKLEKKRKRDRKKRRKDTKILLTAKKPSITKGPLILSKGIKTIWLIAGSLATAMVVILFFYNPAEPTVEGHPHAPLYTTTTTSVAQLGNCGNLQIDVDNVIELSAYYRYGIPRMSGDDIKFILMELTATNKADTFKDFSGYRIELSANGKSHMPLRFDDVESISLLDGSTMDYSCEELALAYPSRFELEAGESATGCKIFQVLEESSPQSLSVYDVEGLKCRISIV